VISFLLAVFVVALTWIYLGIGAISRIALTDESHISIRPLLGRARTIPMADIVDLTLLRLGYLSHVHLRLRARGFWTFDRRIFLIPVRGPWMDQQGPLQTVWGRVPSIEKRL
jgi:hypothetical protein